MAKNKKYEDSHFEEYFDTQTIVNIDIENRMKEKREKKTLQKPIKRERD